MTRRNSQLDIKRDTGAEAAMDTLSVTSYTEGAWTVLHVEGEIDMSTAPQLREWLLELISQGHVCLLVDLDPVEFMDSTGLSVLTATRERARTHGGALRVACTDERILKVFRVTGLTEALGVHPSIRAATSAPLEQTPRRALDDPAPAMH